MSIVIAVVKQPLCCISVDSCQTKIFNPRDPSRNQYYNDVNKIHTFGDFIIAECGNPHGFMDYWAAAERLRMYGAGIEYFIEQSRHLMNAVGAKWQKQYQRKWPNFSPDQLRMFSRTIAVIAGYSRRQGRIILSSVSDDPAMRSEITGDEIFVAGGSPQTSRGTYDYLRKLLVGGLENPAPGLLGTVGNYLSGRRDMIKSREQILQAGILAAQHSGRLERQISGMRTIGGPIGQMYIEADQPPVAVPYRASV